MLRKSIEESHPPGTLTGDEVFLNILKSLYAGEKQAWVGIDNGREVAVGITSTLYDGDSGTKHLLIYSLLGLFSQRPLSEKFWTEARDALMEFALAGGYNNIVAFTLHDHVVEVVKRLGFVTEWKMLEMEVHQNGKVRR